MIAIGFDYGGMDLSGAKIDKVGQQILESRLASRCTGGRHQRRVDRIVQVRTES